MPAVDDIRADEIERLTAVRPEPRQLAWQRLEFYAFLHFGMTTMTDREWGLGHEDPALFDPDALDVDQWMRAIASAGMTGIILTAKHHDGFCLWPSAMTGHTVAASPWRGGEGDLVAEVADSARRHGLRLGVYLSPWDRTEASYGSGSAYDDFFVAQLTELLTQYGDVFSVWFDGANGEGPDGRVQTYDWDRYYEVVRRLRPGAVISVCGPDVRWCGNEAGHTRADEWSVVPGSLRDAERIAEQSQQIDDGEFSRLVRSDEEDLGSRRALEGRLDDLVWYPAEVNTSIRPGWFHHPSEDGAVRSAEELFEIWCSSVGGNATFLLNVPPNAHGLVADPDVRELERLGALIADFRGRALPARLEPSSRSEEGAAAPAAGFGPVAETTWRPADDDPAPTITVQLPSVRAVEAVVLSEDIRLGQRLEAVTVRAVVDGELRDVARAHSVGYRRILRFDRAVATDRLVIGLDETRGLPAVSSVATIGASTPASGSA
ncbi:alpha-L-fucosidase [Rathayibacter oskolensis]|uniref:alpha-L-fucosidase n=1 Tax=Rathayibacter oskolensis TaxID=1891671 RepID=A0A1X7N9F3_9MICO|nr:alpha-L-fucosidase [Rathayibacter oskolensis]SMH33646.1 alpha-L-fucosidase [Rathayibacter oskolensis]